MDEDESGWFVVIEETVGSGQGARFGVSVVTPAPDRDAARHLAYRLAREHEPQHPRMLRQRTVFHQDGDVWLVLLNGATATFHLRISVVRLIGVSEH